MKKFTIFHLPFSIYQRGFTLIEILVAVAIIGILSSFLMVNFISIRQRGRDSQRKSNLAQIQSALEIYRSDTGSYPSVQASYRLNTTTVCPASQSFTNASGNTTYMQKIPCDPLTLRSGTQTYYNLGNYYYYSNGRTYTLAACLENANDSQGATTAPTPAPPAAEIPTCTSNTYYLVNNP